MKTIAEIQESNSTSKTAEYIDACLNMSNEAHSMWNEDSFLTKKLIEAIFSEYEKTKASTCEYSSYRNALACEIWFEKLKTYKSTGKVSF